MDVRCEKCSTEYEFDENRVGANGVTVKCTACGFVFKVHRSKSAPPARATTTLGKGPQGKEWLVRKPDGQMIAFRELTTLQKWIVEGRINRDDEISKNGETWKRLGNILELEPFFSVYEKARALNELIEKGGASLDRVELRGSEVLSAMSPSALAPVGPLPGDGTHRTTQPERPATIGPEFGKSASFSGTARGGTPFPIVHGKPTSPPLRHESGTPSMIGFEGPGSLPSEPTKPPRSWKSNAFSVSLEEEVRDRSDVVERFERQRKLRSVLFSLLILLVLLAGGSAALAKFGPKGNPIQKLAEQYGILPQRSEEDAASRPIEEAHRAFDKDTLKSLEQAESLLDRAASARPSDPRIQGDRALVMFTRADALRREANDLGLNLAEAEARGAGEAQALRQTIEADEASASVLVKKGFEIAAGAYRKAPESFEAARALAEYYRVQQDFQSHGRELARAKRILVDSGGNDAALLYIESAALTRRTKPSEDDTARGKLLAEQALSARPSMNRARMLLARIAFDKKDLPSAKVELGHVLSNAQEHEEAKRLLSMIARSETPILPKPSDVDAGTQPVAVEDPKPERPGELEKTGGSNEEEGDVEKQYESLMNDGDRQRERDRPKRAMTAYEKASDLKPSSAEPFAGMGWCYIDLDKPQSALAAFRKATQANDKYAEAYFGQAEAHRLLGNKDQAILFYEKYIERASEGPDKDLAKKTLADLLQ